MNIEMDRLFSRLEMESDILIIAEVAQAHDGTLGFAHAFIDAVADAGADAIKFQTHIASCESTMREPWRVKFSRQDNLRYDYWKRMEFSEEQWVELKAHCNERALVFLSSPFSPEAFNLLSRVGQPFWKVASGEIGNIPLLRKMVETGKPVLLSSGMSSWDELDQAVEVCRHAEVPFGILQCTTAYPCPPGKVGLNVIGEIRARYGCPVGLSDHSGEIYAGLAAATLGASIIETHVTFHKKCFGPDVLASLNFEQLKELVEGCRFIKESLKYSVDKDAVAVESQTLRRTFGKSLVARENIPVGTVLAEEMLALKKPGDGLPPSAWYDVLGKRVTRSLKEDEFLMESDIGK